MAYDKAVDSAVLDAGLKATADAIREKTGGTDLLTWDESKGFSDAVSGISAGGGDIDALIDGSITEVSSNTVRHIKPYTFYGCNSLESVDFPNVIKIDNEAFNTCAALTDVSFPNVIEYTRAFTGCTSLKSIGFPALLNMKGGYEFRNLKALTNVSLPNVTNIPLESFSNCTSLTSLIFPKVKSINNNAFMDCKSLTYIDFPSLTSIKNNVFYQCYNFKTLILRSETVCSLSSTNSLYNCYRFKGTVNATYNPDGAKDGYIYVPSALVETYKAATNWSSFATQFRALEDYTVDGTITGELDPSKI